MFSICCMAAAGRDISAGKGLINSWIIAQIFATGHMRLMNRNGCYEKLQLNYCMSLNFLNNSICS